MLRYSDKNEPRPGLDVYKRQVKDLDVPLAGKDILIVEDILDSGLTLSYICLLYTSETVQFVV